MAAKCCPPGNLSCLLWGLLAGIGLLAGRPVLAQVPEPEGAEPPAASIDLGTRLELFVDRYLIDTLEGATLRLHTPAPQGRALTFDKPWEGRYCGYMTVILDEGLYRLYYRGRPESGADGSNCEVTCYAESTDGATFTRPNLGLFEVDGFRDNNLILSGMPPLSHNFAPFLDTRPGVAPDARFKALAGIEKSGLHAFASEDGIHWRKLQDGPVLTKGAFDSQNVAFWSEAEQVYVCYFRTWSQGGFEGYRSVSRATSPDFVVWSEPAPMQFGDTPGEHIYTNQTRPYFRAPHLYIATAARFMPGRRVVSVETAEALGGEADYSGDCSETVLLTSRGGNRYDRTFMEGFVRPGLGPENWTSRTNYAACGVVPTGPHEMSMYVQRRCGQTAHYLERLSLRTDGFASVNAPYAGGVLLTKPVIFSGKELVINYATSAAGSIEVEILGPGGAPLPGYGREEAGPIVGDEIERAVAWQGRTDVSSLAGQPVRLRFIMKDADLFSLRFRP